MKHEKKQKFEIWEAFYENNNKPSNQAEFIKSLEGEQKKYLLTNGMQLLTTKKLKSAFSKTQMRNIFNLITSDTEKKNPTKLHVKLIYIAGKADNWDAKNFIRLLLDINQKDTALAKDFIESALAYHKFYATK